MDIDTWPIGHMSVFGAPPLSSDRAPIGMVICRLFFNREVCEQRELSVKAPWVSVEEYSAE
jgi:hypothetical protein